MPSATGELGGSGAAIGEQVVERTPSAPPSAISIELKQAAAELGVLQQRRAATGATLSRAGPTPTAGGVTFDDGAYPWGCEGAHSGAISGAISGAVSGGAAEPAPPSADGHFDYPEDAPDPQELPGGRVSRFKAARMRSVRQ